MAKKILLTILVLIFLTSCISITKGVQNIPTPMQNFVTATLIPTKAQFIPATLTATPESSAPSTLVATVPAKCTNAAILLRDVTIQDDTQVKAGEQFTKTWEFQNTGTCPWVGYTIKFATGDQMNAPLSTPIADTPPSGKVQVSVELTAPSVDGVYTATFTLIDPAGNVIPIGSEKSFWVKILVGNIVLAQNTDVPSINPGVNPNCAYSENAGYVSEIISLINQARADANIPALAVNAQLTQAAQGHSVDMACNNLLSHFGSDGSGWWVRASRAGYSSPSVSEILAIGAPQDAMYQWKSDPGHWEFVMNAAATEFGVGYAYYSQSDYGGYITVDFGG
jgi:uncharacterized protein YkwD